MQTDAMKIFSLPGSSFYCEQLWFVRHEKACYWSIAGFFAETEGFLSFAKTLVQQAFQQI